MSYYHCHIVLAEQKRDKEYFLNDLDRERLLKTIIEPYVTGEQFMFDGYIINPKQVKRLKVTETENGVNFYANKHNDEMARAGIADFGTNRRELPINNGKDI